jgi:hypothetical protein
MKSSELDEDAGEDGDYVIVLSVRPAGTPLPRHRSMFSMRLQPSCRCGCESTDIRETSGSTRTLGPATPRDGQ